MKRRGFTLNELLIVIAIIVLMISLALPAFNALTGSKSQESAQNVISAFLGQARTEAIGVQEIRGVLFFLDKDTDRINMAIVRPAFSTTVGASTVYFLDLVADRDFIALPPGVGFQTLDDPQYPYNAQNDKYIGFNDPTTYAGLGATARVLYGGVILFDGYGKITTAQYGFHCTDAANSTAPTASGTYSRLGSLFATGGVSDVGLVGSTATNFARYSYAAGQTFAGQLGFVLFDKDAFGNSVAGVTTTGRDEDWQIKQPTVNTDADEIARETWLGTNSDHFLVNRFNGTLFKGQ